MLTRNPVFSKRDATSCQLCLLRTQSRLISPLPIAVIIQRPLLAGFMKTAPEGTWRPHTSNWLNWSKYCQDEDWYWPVEISQLNSISRCLISPCKSLLDCNVFNFIYFDWSRSFWIIQRWARLFVHGFCSGFFTLTKHCQETQLLPMVLRWLSSWFLISKIIKYIQEYDLTMKWCNSCCSLNKIFW